MTNSNRVIDTGDAARGAVHPMDAEAELTPSTPQTATPPAAASAAGGAGVTGRETARARLDWVWDVLLIGVLVLGAYFRFTGVNWDENQHLHPDERFLTMVETSIQPVKSLGEYFNSATSSLNPHNRGYGFYVYGTLPLFAVRYVGEWLGETGYDQINLVGRQFSAVMDLGTVLLVYLIAACLFRSRPLALLASTFAAFSVLPIQLSHYFTVDTFTNFFGMLTLYFALWVLPQPEENQEAPAGDVFSAIFADWRSAIPYVLFGLALGLTMASKINAVFLAVLLPGAALLRYLAAPPAQRERLMVILLRNLAMGAVASVIVFRIFQPYAFEGIFTPNPLWIQNLRDLANQSTGDVDFPPALQWARRPIWFSLQNMVLWGLGLPLGLLAWAGFLWMGARIARRLLFSSEPGSRWQASPLTNSLLIWGWTAFYFAYQSWNFTRSMRYQMLVYPTLAIIAAWAVFALWERGRDLRARVNWARVGAVLVGVSVVALTFAWAYAFTRIYDRPMTRVAASRWIYGNVPGPINLHIQSEGAQANQPVAFGSGFTHSAGQPPLVLAFRPQTAGRLYDVTFEHIGSMDGRAKTLRITVSESPDGANPLATTLLIDTFPPEGDPRGKTFAPHFDQPVQLDPAKTYYLSLHLDRNGERLNFAGPVMLGILGDGDVIRQPLPEPVQAMREGEQYQVFFTAQNSGTLSEITLPHVVDWEGRPEPKTLRLTLQDASFSSNVLGTTDLRDAFAAVDDPRGEGYTFRFAQPVELFAERTYLLQLEVVDGPGRIAVYGSKQANESSWDDALPVGLDGYNPYDYNQGIYRSDLNFEMYWDDNEEKRQRFQNTLDQADYIFISSNRQWGTTVRVPERYPMTSVYYRRLLGCPAEKEITWCYSVAEPGMFQGDLGFELAAVFQSDPNLGGLRFNTQFAEEAFTVYDHPKVLIFRKTESYDPERTRAILGSVDLSTVVHLTPRKAGSYPGNLLLPEGRLAAQQAGGTWSQLFDTTALTNQYPGLGAALWYVVIALLGWAFYPFTRLALRGLPDRGYPFARLVGMLALAWVVWVLGSLGVPFDRTTITLVFAALLIANLALAFAQRETLKRELRERWRYLLTIEALFLAFFVVFLLVRLGNPDLWHPWKGGEKPMDFSYFNAVLKSTTFPPYDPWFAGGYINYYYYGFVVVGVPVKWLGIVPAVAYNLILPTLFALLAVGGFSIGWNLSSAVRGNPLPSRLPEGDDSASSSSLVAQNSFTPHFFSGLFSALTLTVLGNLGTVRMIWHGVQRLASQQAPFEEASLIQHIIWTFEGLGRLISQPGTRLPYGPSDWYWIPSRAIPGWVITEFPSFTFLYGDLHAHMIALPITVLAAAWALSVLLGRWGWMGWGHLLGSFALGGLAIGALKPTNTWDWPTFLALGCVAIVYTALRYGQICCFQIPGVSLAVKRVLIALFGVGLLFALSTLMYQPFTAWYGQGYNKIIPWGGDRTPFWSYMTHWGLFLFVILLWMFTETVDWMATTPLSALNRLRPWKATILTGLGLLLVAVLALLLMGVGIAWLALPAAAWAGILLLRPRLPDAKRAALFLTGTALFLTLFVEVARLEGDLDRMNTVFKFYLQAWTLLALSAGGGLIWLFGAVERTWRMGWQSAFRYALMLLCAGALMFPLFGGADKITDRMADEAPHTLDGMAYMPYSIYMEGESTLYLAEDYRAIRWMQENVKGSPVIIEANVPEYRWGSRFTKYTGLPGVVGWNWHQRQQRALTPDSWVFRRVEGVQHFYNTRNRQDVENDLRKYRIRYIVVGQLERALYSADGLSKFEEWNGDLWREVYRDGQTVIYEVPEEVIAPVAKQ